MPDLPDEVDGGLIVRDGSGKPTGNTLNCFGIVISHLVLLTGIFVDNAMDLIPIPPWSGTQVAEYADLTIRTAISYGLTSIHDADMMMEHLDLFKR